MNEKAFLLTLPNTSGPACHGHIAFAVCCNVLLQNAPHIGHTLLLVPSAALQHTLVLKLQK